MNELLAIIIIVFLCCAMFFAWLISMATCPDRMVDLISGSSNQSGSSSSSTPTTSKELISGGSNSPHTKRDFHADPAASAAVKPKKKCSAAFLQLSAPFKQRTAATVADGTDRPNLKKLSVVPEQDEQLTVYSKTSQAQSYQYNNSVRQPLIECSNELSSDSLTGSTVLKHTHTPATVPIVIDMPAERCVEDVIDARRRQRQQQQFEQLIHPQQPQQQFHQLTQYNNNDSGDNKAIFSEDTEEEDTIFLLPTCYDLLQAALAELDHGDDRLVDGDAVSLPNSPLGSPLAAAVTAPSLQPYSHNDYCHSEMVLAWSPDTLPPLPFFWLAAPPQIARRHSISYIV